MLYSLVPLAVFRHPVRDNPKFYSGKEIANIKELYNRSTAILYLYSTLVISSRGDTVGIHSGLMHYCQFRRIFDLFSQQMV